MMVDLVVVFLVVELFLLCGLWFIVFVGLVLASMVCVVICLVFRLWFGVGDFIGTACVYCCIGFDVWAFVDL